MGRAPGSTARRAPRLRPGRPRRWWLSAASRARGSREATPAAPPRRPMFQQSARARSARRRADAGHNGASVERHDRKGLPSSRILTQLASGTTVRSAKVEGTSSGGRGAPSRRAPRRPVSERAREESRAGHVAQGRPPARAVCAAPARRKATTSTTWSPGATVATPGPRARPRRALVPEDGRERARGVPRHGFRSLRHTPLAVRRTSTSAGPGGARSSSSIANGLRCS